MITNHSISPSSGVYTDGPLYCSATATDPNDGNITNSIVYAWTINGLGVGSGVIYTPSSNDSDVGDDIICQASVTDSDGQTVSSLVSYDWLNAIQSMFFSTLFTISISRATTVVDPDEPLLVIDVWTFAGSVVGSGNPLLVSTTNAMPGDSVTCGVSVTDSDGATDASAASVVVSNRAPSTPTATITWSGNAGYPTTGDTLFCSGTATDPDGQSVYLSYSWTSSSGQTAQGSSVSGGLVQGGFTWTCEISASDGSLSSSGTADVQVQTPCMPDSEYETLSLGGNNDAEFVRVCGGIEPLGRYSITSDMMMLSSKAGMLWT